MIIYNELLEAMTANNITSFTIKKGHAKENLINQYTFGKINNNSGSIGLDVLERLLHEMNIERVEFLKSGDDYIMHIPPVETEEQANEE